LSLTSSLTFKDSSKHSLILLLLLHSSVADSYETEDDGEQELFSFKVLLTG